MKLFISIVFSLLCLFSKGQFIKQSLGGSPGIENFVRGILSADIGTVITPYPDTITANKGPNVKKRKGLMILVQDTIYVRDTLHHKWIAFLSASTKGIDSVVVYSNTICQWKNGVPTCYTISSGGGGNIFIGIDSITANLTSICQWKNGVPNCYPLMGPGIDSVTLKDTVLCQWSSGIPGCYIIHGNVVQTGPTDSLKVTGNNYCWYFSGVPTCITINNVGKYYDATSLNFDSTKYIHYNNGVPIDSITTLIKPVIGDTCILIRDSSNGKTYFYLNPNCRSGGGGTLQQAFDAAPTANPQINAHNNAFIIDSSAYFIINTYDGIYGVSSIELAGSQSSIFSTTATGTSENVVDGGSSRLSFTNQSLSKSNTLALDSAKTVFYNLDSTARLGVNTSNPLAATHIVGNGTDPVLLAMNGNVGIGTTTPTAKTHIVAPDSNVLKLEGLINTPLLTDSMLVIGTNKNVKKAAIPSSGSTGVTSVATGYGLSGGTITTTGTLIADSATLSLKYLRRADSVFNPGFTSLFQYNKGKDSLQTNINLKANIASPTFTGTVTIPNGAVLNTPTSVTLTNATGLPVSTGISGLATGIATWLATPSSANLLSALTTKTGTGNAMFSISPTSTGLLTTDTVLTQRLNLSGSNFTSKINLASTGSYTIANGLVWGANDVALYQTSQFGLGTNGSFTVTGATIANSSLTVSSGNTSVTSFKTAYAAKTANYTIAANDYTINCTANSFTVTLPTAVGTAGQEYEITNSGAGTITIATTSSQTFSNVSGTPTTLTMSTVGTRKVKSTGAAYLLVSSL